VNPNVNPDAAILITGATSGLGRISAKRLALNGRSIVVHGRRPDAVDEVVKEIVAAGGSARSIVADLSDLDQVRRLVGELENVELHGIMANAGITTSETDQRSAQGYDLTFAVNVLAHHLILTGLASQVRPSGRIVVVSSGVHDPDNKLARRAGIPVPKWVGVESMAYPDRAPATANLDNGRQRYSNSKLCNILQARTLQGRLREANRLVDVFALDPGLMVDTDLAREAPAPARAIFKGLGRIFTPLVGNMRLSTETAEVVAALFEEPRWSDRGFAYLDGPHAQDPSPDAQRDNLANELWVDTTNLLSA